MKSADLFFINGIGWLDLAEIGKKGRYTNIAFTIWTFRKSKPRTKKGIITYKTFRRRLRNVMTIRLGLTLVKPLFMPGLVSELVMIKETDEIGVEAEQSIDNKIETTLMRTTRIKRGLTTTHFYPDTFKSAFDLKYHTFFRKLKAQLKASHLNCIIECSNPGYVEITATIERRTFKFPARFLVDLVAAINSNPSPKP